MNSTAIEEEKVRYISLVRKEGGEPIIGIPYREMRVDPDLVASFVLAVVIFEGRQLKTFMKEGYVVVIEQGDYVVGMLIIDRVDEETPYRAVLREVITEFEERYSKQLERWDGDIRPFREFALDILGFLPYQRLDSGLVPKMVQKSEAMPDRQQKIPWSVGETDEKLQMILGYVNGKRTIQEIMDASGLSEDEITAIFSMLIRYNWISLSKPLREDTVLLKLTNPPEFLLGVYGDELIQLVELCDGSRSLIEVVKEVPLNLEVVRTVARNLIDAGVLGYAE
ncbi:hypothetical protein EU520_01490 [Candidatus Thorarchaeota archaeon]|nr:MAG: hypothetical protein EU520_01490 [Candidatus Thorarchaeota archaeon]